MVALEEHLADSQGALNWRQATESVAIRKYFGQYPLTWLPFTDPWLDHDVLRLSGYKLSRACQRETGWWFQSTNLKSISQFGNLPQVGLKIKNLWNHHLGKHLVSISNFREDPQDPLWHHPQLDAPKGSLCKADRPVQSQVPQAPSPQKIPRDVISVYRVYGSNLGHEKVLKVSNPGWMNHQMPTCLKGLASPKPQDQHLKWLLQKNAQTTWPACFMFYTVYSCEPCFETRIWNQIIWVKRIIYKGFNNPAQKICGWFQVD